MQVAICYTASCPKLAVLQAPSPLEPGFFPMFKTDFEAGLSPKSHLAHTSQPLLV